MRYRIAFALGLIALLGFTLSPSATMGQAQDDGAGQFQGKGRGKGKKGNFGGGNFGGKKGGGPGGFQGFAPGGGPGGFQGRGGFQMPGGFQGGRGGFQPGGAQGGNPDNMDQTIEADFKLRDRNGDGYLNQDEMPDQLKAELTTWDTNRDNLISLDEYKAFSFARMQSRRGQGNQPGVATIIIEEEDLDTRPVVFRAGKLPKELPAWFKKLDTDKDGQVALYEWRKAGKDIDEFKEWDRNNDGYITAEEALYKQRLIQVASAATKTEDGDAPSPAFSAGRDPNAGGGPGGRGQGKKGGGPNRNRSAQ